MCIFFREIEIHFLISLKVNINDINKRIFFCEIQN